MSGINAHVAASREALGKTICERLIKRGFTSAEYAPTREAASDAALALISSGQTVGAPGSVTVRELGLIERLEAKGCRVFQHWDPNLKPENRARRLLDEFTADWLVTSGNAITYDGVMVNIDGAGNRIAAMSWAPGSALYLIGMNKAVPDTASAIERARWAGVPNAIRLGIDLPCVKAGHCVKCGSPKCICRVISIIEMAPLGRESRVILIGEDSGY